MNDFTDHLESWWNNASVTSPREGDTIIFREAREDGTHYYGIETAEEDFAGDSKTRILHRAPKPRPAWHDAVAVIATYRDDCGMVSGVWTPEGKPGYWEGPEGDVVASERLENVTPLIEARVTDEMIRKARKAVIDWEYRPRLDTTIRLDLGDKGSTRLARDILTAALGLDNE